MRESCIYSTTVPSDFPNRVVIAIALQVASKGIIAQMEILRIGAIGITRKYGSFCNCDVDVTAIGSKKIYGVQDRRNLFLHRKFDVSVGTYMSSLHWRHVRGVRGARNGMQSLKFISYQLEPSTKEKPSHCRYPHWTTNYLDIDTYVQYILTYDCSCSVSLISQRAICRSSRAGLQIF